MNMVAISSLRFGHDPDAPEGVANVRRAGRDEGIAELAASILAHGIIQPLAVVAAPRRLHYVADGNRRLAALHTLVADGQLSAKTTVPVVEREAAEAREIGLAANVLRADLHPADRYVAYRDLVEAGSSPQAIATRFGVSEADVKRAVALGNLAPEVVDAWRASEIPRDPLQVVKIFTLAPVDVQATALARLKQSGNWWPDAVREALGVGSDWSAETALRLVGREAYEAAGGVIVDDLFGDKLVIRDPALAKRLAADVLRVECDRLVQAGWSWAATAADLPNGARWTWKSVVVDDVAADITDDEGRRLDELDVLIVGAPADDVVARTSREERDAIYRAVEDRACPPDVRARAGCQVDIGRDGDIVLLRGLVRPGDAVVATDDPASRTETPVAKPRLSAALTQRLDEQRAQAMRDALPSSPKAGLAVLLAGATATYATPVRFRVEREQRDGPAEVVTYTAALARYMSMSVDDLLLAASHVAARALVLNGTGGSDIVAAADAISDVLDPAALRDGLAARFDVAAYLGSVTKALVLEAVGDVLGEETVKRLSSWKKSDLIADCADDIRRAGWLPPELRPTGYALLTPVERAAAA